MRLLLVACLLATSGVARAEPDPTVAQSLATAGTVLPLGGLMFSTFGRTKHWRPILATSYVALAIAPSSGHFYAGDSFTAGLGVRLIGASIVGLSFTAMDCEDDGDVPGCIPVGVYTALLGTITMVVGAGLDIASADDAASQPTTARMITIGGSF
jgi:hypothetical protein